MGCWQLTNELCDGANCTETPNVAEEVTMPDRRFALFLLLAAGLAVAGVRCGAPGVSAKDGDARTSAALAAGRHVFVAADGA